MKKYLLFASLLLSAVAYANDDYVVSDPDGFTNLREHTSLTSKVISKIPNGTPISCIDDSESFCFLTSSNGNEGYIHRSRVKSLAKDPNFERLPIVKRTPTAVTFSYDNTTVNVAFREKTLSRKDFTPDKNGMGYSYLGKPFYGTDNDLPVAYNDKGDVINKNNFKAYFFDNVDLTVNGKKVSVPKSEFIPYFITGYFIDVDEATQYTTAYYNPKDQHLYLFSTQSQGGAAGYTVVFEFKNGQYVRHYDWLDVI